MARTEAIKKPNGSRVIEGLILLVDAIQTCYKHLNFIVMTGESIINDLEKRQIL